MGDACQDLGGLGTAGLNQGTFDTHTGSLHAIEARIYSENPSADFKPSPGVLQHVHFPSGDGYEWLRTDAWVETGTTITPYFDPLVAKVIVQGSTREEAIDRLQTALAATRVCGPPNNLSYLRAITEDRAWRAGAATTNYLAKFEYTPRFVLSHM